MNNRTKWMTVLAALSAPAVANAACPTTSLTILDGRGGQQVLCYGGAAGGFIYQNQLVDSGGANIAGVDSSGRVAVQAPPSMPLPSGASTVTNQTAIQVLQGGFAAAANAVQVAGVYNSVLPTITSGSAVALQVDTNGREIISPTNLSIAQASTTSGQTGSLVMGASTTSSPSENAGFTYPLSLDLNGNLRVYEAANALSQGSTTVGQVGSIVMGAASTSPPTYTSGLSYPVSLDTAGNLRETPIPNAASGTSVFSTIAAGNTTSVAVKASAGQIYGIRTFSNNTTQVYGKLYNTTQANVTCGGGLTPQDRFSIPAQTGGAGFVVPIPYGEKFTNAITLCVTGGIADNASTSVSAASYLVSIDYE